MITKKYIYILLSLIAILVWRCNKSELLELDTESVGGGCVEVLEDGRLLVSGSFSGTAFGDVSVGTRADADTWTTLENKVVDGWCLIFGEEPSLQYDDSISYTTNSPLLEKLPLTVNSNGTFYVTLTPYPGVAFLRIVVNLTDREDDILSATTVKCWADYTSVAYDDDGSLTMPTAQNIIDYPVSTFGEYEDQSVGLDGIYAIDYSITAENLADEVYNEIKPNPLSPSSAFPMSSVGFVLSSGISEETISQVFGTTIYLVRACSKVDITVSTTEFLLKEVYLIDCAQESLIRSSVLSSSGSDGSETLTSFDVPVDLGGAISYLALVEDVSNDSDDTDTYPDGDTDNTTKPIYIYPNSGGAYDSNDGAVDKDVNPQYIIIKGRAGRYFEEAFYEAEYVDEDGNTVEAIDIPAGYAYGYDTDGYYKIALKAQYPLTYEYDNDGNIVQDEETGSFNVLTWSDLTYDVLRNTHFNIEILSVDKPGYKTYEDAIDPNNPATNISYSITIIGQDGRNEILVSNGAYFAELGASRVYAKGYSSFSGTFQFDVTPNSADTAYQHPAIYVMADYNVDVTGCSYTTNGKTTESVKEELNSEYADDQDVNVKDYWYKVPESKYSSAITIDYTATASGRLRLRIGDILKFIPVRFDGVGVTSKEGALSFLNESATSFAYTGIESAFDNTTYEDLADLSILNSDGEVEENETDVARQFRSKIYTNSGNAMLYFWQNMSTDSNQRVPDETTDEVGEGNVVEVESYSADSTAYANMSSSEKVVAEEEARENLADAVTDALLGNGYTTVYIETGYYNEYITADGSADNQDNIFTSIEKEVCEAIAAGDLLDTYTYSIDLSGLTQLDTKPNSDDVFMYLYGGLFTGLTHLESLILPSTIEKIKPYAFYGCTSLKSVGIGSESAPLTNFGGIDNYSFSGMQKGCIITIYTSENIDSYADKESDVSSYTTTTSISDTGDDVFKYEIKIDSCEIATGGEALLASLKLLLEAE